MEISMANKIVVILIFKALLFPHLLADFFVKTSPDNLPMITSNFTDSFRKF